MSLLNSGSVAYNGVIWGALYRSKVECKPVKDSAGRALVARDYLIDVEGRIGAAPGETTDATLTNMRQLLEMPAGALVYEDKGFGSLSVNVPGGNLWDAAYGPWPEVLAWDPVGNDQSCLVRWRCTTRVPCEEDPSAKGIIEYCYSTSWDTDHNGYTKRIIQGHLTIQATRRSVTDRNIPDNADAYLDRVVPDLPVGFRRKQHRDLSEDKRTIKFQFEDEEMSSPLPEGVSEAVVHHKVAWRLPAPGEIPIKTTLSGSITVPARVDAITTWDRIILIMRSRWPVGGAPGGKGAGAVAARGIAGGVAGAIAAIEGVKAEKGKAKGYTFLLTSLEVDESLFDPGSSFSATAWIIGAKSPAELLNSSGLWDPIKDEKGRSIDFVRWRQSMFAPKGAGKPYAPRGMAGMAFDNGDDAIVDLCGRENPPRLLAGRLPPQQRKLTAGRAPAGRKELDPKATWISYRLRLRLLENDRIAEHVPLKSGDNVKPEPISQGVASEDYKDSPGLKPPQPNEIGGYISKPGPGIEKPKGQSAGVYGGSASKVQRVSAPRYRIRLEGYAVRIGYPIPTPRLKTVGGVDVTQRRQNVAQELVSNIAGVPMYAASWIVDYVLPQVKKLELPMPDNPAVS